MSISRMFSGKPTRRIEEFLSDEALSPTPDVLGSVNPVYPNVSDYDISEVREDILTALSYLEGVYPSGELNNRLDWYGLDFSMVTDDQLVNALEVMNSDEIQELYFKITTTAVDQGLPADSFKLYDSIVNGEIEGADEPVEGAENVPETADNVPVDSPVPSEEEPIVDINRPLIDPQYVEGEEHDYDSKVIQNRKEDEDKSLEDLKKELEDEKGKDKPDTDKVKELEGKIKDLEKKEDSKKDEEGDLEDLKGKLEEEKKKDSPDKDKIKELEDKIAKLEKKEDSKNVVKVKDSYDQEKLIMGLEGVGNVPAIITLLNSGQEEAAKALLGVSVPSGADPATYWLNVIVGAKISENEPGQLVDSKKKEDELTVSPIGLRSGVFLIMINGSRYGYDASEDTITRFYAILKHSVGKALAYLKKNAKLIYGSKAYPHIYLPGDENSKVKLGARVWHDGKKFVFATLDGKVASFDSAKDFHIDVRSSFGDKKITLDTAQAASMVPVEVVVDSEISEVESAFERSVDAKAEYTYTQSKYLVAFQAKDGRRVVLPLVGQKKDELSPGLDLVVQALHENGFILKNEIGEGDFAYFDSTSILVNNMILPSAVQCLTDRGIAFSSIAGDLETRIIA